MNNPYSPPQSDLETSAAKAPEGRPTLVWIIFIWAMFSVVSGSLGTLMMLNKWLPLPDFVTAYYASIPWWQHLLSVLSLTLYAIAGVQLFRLRKQALALFGAHLVFALIGCANAFSNEHYNKMLEQTGGNSLSTFLGLAVSLLILGYVFRLYRKGILQAG